MSLVRRSVEYSAAALAVEIVLGRGGRTGKALLLLDGHGIFCAAAVQLERALLRVKRQYGRHGHLISGIRNSEEFADGEREPTCRARKHGADILESFGIIVLRAEARISAVEERIVDRLERIHAVEHPMSERGKLRGKRLVRNAP